MSATIFIQIRSNETAVWSVYEVNEYVRMDWHCSHDSYFKCLAKRYKEIKFSDISSKINKGYFNTSKCQWEKICTPISLPPVGENYIPVCRFLSTDEECHILTLDRLKLDQYKHCAFQEKLPYHYSNH